MTVEQVEEAIDILSKGLDREHPAIKYAVFQLESLRDLYGKEVVVDGEVQETKVNPLEELYKREIELVEEILNS